MDALRKVGAGDNKQFFVVTCDDGEVSAYGGGRGTTEQHQFFLMMAYAAFREIFDPSDE